MTGQKQINNVEEVIIRNACVQDAEGIFVLCRDALGYASTPELIKTNLQRLSRDREVVFVANAGGRTAGFIHAEKYTALYAETFVNILGLAVGEEFRHRQIGSGLLSAAEEWAKAQGISLVRVNSRDDRIGAHEFYRAKGYRVVKRQIRFLKEL